MAKYRKRPVVIEAVQWTGENNNDVYALYDSVPSAMKRSFHIDQGCVFIETLEGTMRANRLDYIIRGVKGELYPCKPDIFEATYEAV